MRSTRLVVMAVAACATLVAALPATATARACSVNNNQEGVPGVDKLRATGTTCATARGVVAKLHARARLGELERRPVVKGRRFSCSFTRKSGANGEYLATVCRRKSATVSLQYYATGLLR